MALKLPKDTILMASRRERLAQSGWAWQPLQALLAESWLGIEVM
jgi:hypothetical protein